MLQIRSVSPDVDRNAFKVTGVLSGFAIGWYLERRYVGFSTDSEVLVKERVARGVVGAIVMGIVYAATSMIFKAIIYSTGFLIILQYYDISITPIITALGVGGMAVALGLQETLANIFSGLQLILSRQIRVSDYIRLNTGDEGRVMDINWRFTTIMPAAGGSEVVIPNKTIAASITTNYSRPQDDIVITIPVGVAYDSDLDQVERVTLAVATEIMIAVDDYQPRPDADGKDRNPMAPAVRFHTFGESSINFNVVLHSSQFGHQYLLKHEFIKALTKRYREKNIEIPFPIRTIVQA